MNFGHIKNIHFVGIGGIGMSGIAEILAAYGFHISGCDAKSTAITDRLDRNGVNVSIGHDASHAADADLVVISSAVRRDHPELLAARELHVPVIRRAEMLGEMMRLKRGIAISGTHGKTTTSAMTAIVLAEAGLDPTLIVGGVLRNLESSAKLGASDFLVVEADEYDRSFLTLHPTYAVITNIEADHLDCYKDLDDIRRTFAEFASKVPFYGMLVGCSDDENVRALLDESSKRALRYGTGPEADLRATDMKFSEGGCSYALQLRGKLLGSVSLHVPGEHNVRNSLAAIAIALELDIPFETIAAALSRFGGVERRFQILGDYRGAIVVDDYAHHPTEVRATLEAARRGFPDRRIVALFQPHLFTRTRDFFKDFAEALRLADQAFVAPLYPAREEPIEGVNSAMITDAARSAGALNVKLLDWNQSELVHFFRDELKSNDLFLTMGAGDVNRVGFQLVGASW